MILEYWRPNKEFKKGQTTLLGNKIYIAKKDNISVLPLPNPESFNDEIYDGAITQLKSQIETRYNMVGNIKYNNGEWSTAR